MSKDITERQKEILDFIESKIIHDGFAPTLMEIGDKFGIRNPNGVKSHLTALEKKGYLKRTKEMARAIQIKPKADALPHFISSLKHKFWESQHFYTCLHFHLGLLTRKSYPFFHGKWKDLLEDKIFKKAANHEWEIKNLDIGYDYVKIELFSTPDHSVERIVNNIKNATNVLSITHPLYFHGKNLWAPGFAAASNPSFFEDLFNSYKLSFQTPKEE